MEIQNEIKNNADDMRDVIVSVEHLKTYFNAGKTWGKKQVVKAVDDVSFQIHKGETYGLVGESGSGKSTLGRTIVKINEPTEGKIIVNDTELRKLRSGKTAKYRRKVGVVFQDFRLLKDRNVYENIAFAQRVIGVSTREIKKNVPRMLSLVGLSEKYKSFPNELSGGEQQRVALARALVNKPALLLADEPTGNLDPGNSWEIMKLLDEINKQGTTVVVVTHNMEIVERMQKRVITMKKGIKVSDSKVD